MHASTRALLRFFDYGHLDHELYEVAEQFQVFAERMANDLPENAETTAALRKLLEAKDCCIRAALDK